MHGTCVLIVYTHTHTCTHAQPYIYSYTYIYTHTINTHNHIYIHIQPYIHTYTHIQSYIHIYTQPYMHTYMHTHKQPYRHSHIHTHIHYHTHTHTNIHIHTLKMPLDWEVPTHHASPQETEAGGQRVQSQPRSDCEAVTQRNTMILKGELSVVLHQGWGPMRSSPATRVCQLVAMLRPRLGSHAVKISRVCIQY